MKGSGTNLCHSVPKNIVICAILACTINGCHQGVDYGIRLHYTLTLSFSLLSLSGTHKKRECLTCAYVRAKNKGSCTGLYLRLPF